jgi:SAM-dependent methyltransferase
LRILASQARPRLRNVKRATWWEIFDASDIGAERRMIVDRFVPSSLSVLDVGCGRGFFSFACARRAKRVMCLDLMDGGGRTGWWKEFRDSAGFLKISKRLSGVRGSAASLPFGRECFDLVASVHSMRNFRKRGEARPFFSEVMRTLKKGGRMVLVESDLEDEKYRTYGAFYALRVKLGWELELPSFSTMAGWLKRAGFAEVSMSSIDTELKYAPVYFPYDHSTMKGVEGAYKKAKRLLLEEGEPHPPVFVLTATKP